MSTTVLRLGLWILILVMALFVLAENSDSQIAELIPHNMLTQALMLAGGLVVLGLILKLFEKATRSAVKNRCQICRTPIPTGALYCRQHLRRILQAEDDRTHSTRIR